MSLQFVLGNSGSGKTNYMYRQVVKEAGENPLKNYLVIVPEQFTMATQRKLVDLSPNKAIMNIDVLSFERLAYRIFDELGIKQLDVLEETGKNLVLRKVAGECLDQLHVLQPNIHRMGYISEVKSLLSEFSQYNIGVEELEGLCENTELSGVLRAKLKDVAVLYKGFRTFIKDRYITAEEVLHVLCDVADESAILKNSVLVFDEFTGFTPVQNQLFKALLPIVEKVMVSLTIDHKEDFYRRKGMQELFDMPKKTIAQLQKMAVDLQVEELEPIVLGDSAKMRFKESPVLAHMEANLFRTGTKAWDGDVLDISISNLKMPKEEVVFVAREINRLIREEGYHYHDFAVVTGAVETYGNYVEEVFAKYNIPHFLDATSNLVFQPFIELIRGLLEVMENDFSQKSVMRVLRTGFFDFTTQEVDVFENYLLATGMAGKKRWSKRWSHNPKNARILTDTDTDLARIEEMRKSMYDMIFPAYEVFAVADSTVAGQVVALYELLCKLGVEAKLEERRIACEEAGEPIKAKEYEQIYKIVMSLFEKYHFLLGEEHLSMEEFAEVLDAGFDAAKVATIPPALDSVVVGDIERTRLGQIKVMFFLGVNEGIVPKAAGRGGIISQYEREVLKELEIELSPTPREQAFIQKYYLYMNMTKPSRRLYVSFSRTGAVGDTLRPSYLIGTLTRMFPNVKVTEYEDFMKMESVATKEAALDYFIYGKREGNWHALAKCLLEENPEYEEYLKAHYAHYEDAPISKVVAEAIYGRELKGSVTRIEQFARCEYAHFLRYGLGLREREECSFEGMDIGNLYHASLEKYSRTLEASEYDWFKVPEDVQKEFAKKAMEEAILDSGNVTLQATQANAHAIRRMQGIFETTIWALTKQVRSGEFVPSEFECKFEVTEEIEGGRKATFVSKIDRVDLYENGNEVCVKVIDYKTGGTSYDLVKIYKGEQLQLCVYLDMATRMIEEKRPNANVTPGALFYYKITEPEIDMAKCPNEDDWEETIFRELRPDGPVNAREEIYLALDKDLDAGVDSQVIPVKLKKDNTPDSHSKVLADDEFAVLKEYTKMRIKQAVKDIYDGKITVNPAESSCKYCAYSSICAINSKLPGYEVRKEEKMDKKDVIEAMETAIALWKGGSHE